MSGWFGGGWPAEESSSSGSSYYSGEGAERRRSSRSSAGRRRSSQGRRRSSHRLPPVADDDASESNNVSNSQMEEEIRSLLEVGTQVEVLYAMFPPPLVDRVVKTAAAAQPQPAESQERRRSHQDDAAASRGSSHHSGSVGSRSYYSEDGSRYSQSQGSRSYYSEDGSQGGHSRYSGGSQGSRYSAGSRGSRSRYSGGGSHQGSRYSGSSQGSRRGRYSGDDGGHRSGGSEKSLSLGDIEQDISSGGYSDEASRSAEDSRQSSGGSRSRYSRDGSRSRYSQDDSRSRYSGDGSRSEYSGDGSRSRYSSGRGSRGSRGSQSRYSESGSRHSGDEGSQYSWRSGGNVSGESQFSQSHFASENQLPPIDQDSHHLGSDSRSGSRHSGGEGSQYSWRSGSHVSGESQFSRGHFASENQLPPNNSQDSNRSQSDSGSEGWPVSPENSANVGRPGQSGGDNQQEGDRPRVKDPHQQGSLSDASIEIGSPGGGSQHSGDDRSYYSGSDRGSYYSGSGSRSYHSGSRSYYSGSGSEDTAFLQDQKDIERLLDLGTELAVVEEMFTPEIVARVIRKRQQQQEEGSFPGSYSGSYSGSQSGSERHFDDASMASSVERLSVVEEADSSHRRDADDVSVAPNEHSPNSLLGSEEPKAKSDSSEKIDVQDIPFSREGAKDRDEPMTPGSNDMGKADAIELDAVSSVHPDEEMIQVNADSPESKDDSRGSVPQNNAKELQSTDQEMKDKGSDDDLSPYGSDSIDDSVDSASIADDQIDTPPKEKDQGSPASDIGIDSDEEHASVGEGSQQSRTDHHKSQNGEPGEDDRSYYSDDGSYYSGSGSRSYHSGHGSGGSRSYYSGSDGSRSYFSGSGSADTAFLQDQKDIERLLELGTELAVVEEMFTPEIVARVVRKRQQDHKEGSFSGSHSRSQSVDGSGVDQNLDDALRSSSHRQQPSAKGSESDSHSEGGSISVVSSELSPEAVNDREGQTSRTDSPGQEVHQGLPGVNQNQKVDHEDIEKPDTQVPMVETSDVNDSGSHLVQIEQRDGVDGSVLAPDDDNTHGAATAGQESDQEMSSQYSQASPAKGKALSDNGSDSIDDSDDSASMANDQIDTLPKENDQGSPASDMGIDSDEEHASVGEGSQQSRTERKSHNGEPGEDDRSYYRDDGSYYSGSGSRSYHSGHGSGGSRSYYSGSDGRSYFSGSGSEDTAFLQDQKDIERLLELGTELAVVEEMFTPEIVARVVRKRQQQHQGGSFSGSHSGSQSGRDGRSVHTDDDSHVHQSPTLPKSGDRSRHGSDGSMGASNESMSGLDDDSFSEAHEDRMAARNERAGSLASTKTSEGNRIPTGEAMQSPHETHPTQGAGEHHSFHVQDHVSDELADGIRVEDGRDSPSAAHSVDGHSDVSLSDGSDFSRRLDDTGPLASQEMDVVSLAESAHSDDNASTGDIVPVNTFAGSENLSSRDSQIGVQDEPDKMDSGSEPLDDVDSLGDSQSYVSKGSGSFISREDASSLGSGGSLSDSSLESGSFPLESGVSDQGSYYDEKDGIGDDDDISMSNHATESEPVEAPRSIVGQHSQESGSQHDSSHEDKRAPEDDADAPFGLSSSRTRQEVESMSLSPSGNDRVQTADVSDEKPQSNDASFPSEVGESSQRSLSEDHKGDSGGGSGAGNNIKGELASRESSSRHTIGGDNQSGSSSSLDSRAEDSSRVPSFALESDHTLSSVQPTQANQTNQTNQNVRASERDSVSRGQQPQQEGHGSLSRLERSNGQAPFSEENSPGRDGRDSFSGSEHSDEHSRHSDEKYSGHSGRGSESEYSSVQSRYSDDISSHSGTDSKHEDSFAMESLHQPNTQHSNIAHSSTTSSDQVDSFAVESDHPLMSQHSALNQKGEYVKSKDGDEESESSESRESKQQTRYPGKDSVAESQKFSSESHDSYWSHSEATSAMDSFAMESFSESRHAAGKTANAPLPNPPNIPEGSFDSDDASQDGSYSSRGGRSYSSRGDGSYSSRGDRSYSSRGERSYSSRGDGSYSSRSQSSRSDRSRDEARVEGSMSTFDDSSNMDSFAMDSFYNASMHQSALDTNQSQANIHADQTVPQDATNAGIEDSNAANVHAVPVIIEGTDEESQQTISQGATTDDDDRQQPAFETAKDAPEAQFLSNLGSQINEQESEADKIEFEIQGLLDAGTRVEVLEAMFSPEQVARVLNRSKQQSDERQADALKQPKDDEDTPENPDAEQNDRIEGHIKPSDNSSYGDESRSVSSYESSSEESHLQEIWNKKPEPKSDESSARSETKNSAKKGRGFFGFFSRSAGKDTKDSDKEKVTETEETNKATETTDKGKGDGDKEKPADITDTGKTVETEEAGHNDDAAILELFNAGTDSSVLQAMFNPDDVLRVLGAEDAKNNGGGGSYSNGEDRSLHSDDRSSYIGDDKSYNSDDQYSKDDRSYNSKQDSKASDPSHSPSNKDETKDNTNEWPMQRESNNEPDEGRKASLPQSPLADDRSTGRYSSEGSRSYYSDEEDRSRYSDDRSKYSQDDRSYNSDDKSRYSQDNRSYDSKQEFKASDPSHSPPNKSETKHNIAESPGKGESKGHLDLADLGWEVSPPQSPANDQGSRGRYSSDGSGSYYSDENRSHHSDYSDQDKSFDSRDGDSQYSDRMSESSRSFDSAVEEVITDIERLAELGTDIDVLEEMYSPELVAKVMQRNKAQPQQDVTSDDSVYSSHERSGHETTRIDGSFDAEEGRETYSDNDSIDSRASESASDRGSMASQHDEVDEGMSDESDPQGANRASPPQPANQAKPETVSEVSSTPRNLQPSAAAQNAGNDQNDDHSSFDDDPDTGSGSSFSSRASDVKANENSKADVVVASTGTGSSGKGQETKRSFFDDSSESGSSVDSRVSDSDVEEPNKRTAAVTSEKSANVSNQDDTNDDEDEDKWKADNEQGRAADTDLFPSDTSEALNTAPVHVDDEVERSPQDNSTDYGSDLSSSFGSLESESATSDFVGSRVERNDREESIGDVSDNISASSRESTERSFDRGDQGESIHDDSVSEGSHEQGSEGSFDEQGFDPSDGGANPGAADTAKPGPHEPRASEVFAAISDLYEGGTDRMVLDSMFSPEDVARVIDGAGATKEVPRRGANDIDRGDSVGPHQAPQEHGDDDHSEYSGSSEYSSEEASSEEDRLAAMWGGTAHRKDEDKASDAGIPEPDMDFAADDVSMAGSDISAESAQSHEKDVVSSGKALPTADQEEAASIKELHIAGTRRSVLEGLFDPGVVSGVLSAVENRSDGSDSGSDDESHLQTEFEADRGAAGGHADASEYRREPPLEESRHDIGVNDVEGSASTDYGSDLSSEESPSMHRPNAAAEPPGDTFQANDGSHSNFGSEGDYSGSDFTGSPQQSHYDATASPNGRSDMRQGDDGSASSYYSSEPSSGQSHGEQRQITTATRPRTDTAPSPESNMVDDRSSSSYYSSEPSSGQSHSGKGSKYSGAEPSDRHESHHDASAAPKTESKEFGGDGSSESSYFSEEASSRGSRYEATMDSQHSAAAARTGSHQDDRANQESTQVDDRYRESGVFGEESSNFGSDSSSVENRSAGIWRGGRKQEQQKYTDNQDESEHVTAETTNDFADHWPMEKEPLSEDDRAAIRALFEAGTDRDILHNMFRPDQIDSVVREMEESGHQSIQGSLSDDSAGSGILSVESYSREESIRTIRDLDAAGTDRKALESMFSPDLVAQVLDGRTQQGGKQERRGFFSDEEDSSEYGSSQSPLESSQSSRDNESSHLPKDRSQTKRTIRDLDDANTDRAALESMFGSEAVTRALDHSSASRSGSGGSSGHSSSQSGFGFFADRQDKARDEQNSGSSPAKETRASTDVDKKEPPERKSQPLNEGSDSSSYFSSEGSSSDFGFQRRVSKSDGGMAASVADSQNLEPSNPLDTELQQTLDTDIDVASAARNVHDSEIDPFDAVHDASADDADDPFADVNDPFADDEDEHPTLTMQENSKDTPEGNFTWQDPGAEEELHSKPQVTAEGKIDADIRYWLDSDTPMSVLETMFNSEDIRRVASERNTLSRSVDPAVDLVSLFSEGIQETEDFPGEPTAELPLPMEDISDEENPNQQLDDDIRYWLNQGTPLSVVENMYSVEDVARAMRGKQKDEPGRPTAEERKSNEDANEPESNGQNMSRSEGSQTSDRIIGKQLPASPGSSVSKSSKASRGDISSTRAVKGKKGKKPSPKSSKGGVRTILNEELSSTLLSLKDDLEEVGSKNSQLEALVAKLESEKAELVARLEEFDTVREENRALKKENKNLNKKVTKHEGEEEEESKSAKKALKKENKKLIKRVTKYKSKKNEQESQVAESKSANKALKKENKKLKKRVSKIEGQQELETVQQENLTTDERLMKKMERLERQAAHSKKHLHNAKKRIKALSEEVAATKENNSVLERDAEAYKKLADSKIESYKEILNESNKEIKLLNGKNESLASTISMLAEKGAEYSKQLTQANQRIQVLADENKALVGGLDKSLHQQEELHATIARMKEDWKKREEDIYETFGKEMQERIDEKTVECEEKLQEASAEVEQITEERDQLASELELLQDLAIDRKHLLLDVNDKLRYSAVENLELMEKCERTSKKCEMLSTAMEGLEIASEEKDKEVEALNESVDQLKTDLAGAYEEIWSLEQERDELHDKVRDLDFHAGKYKSTLEDAYEELDIIAAENKDLKSSLYQSMDECQNLRDAKDIAERSLQTTERNIQSFHEILNETKEDMDFISAENKVLLEQELYARPKRMRHYYDTGTAGGGRQY
ncbi:expressed unknown protein [Seminavis robusta]|uniref:Uncharacterized protein n=1 Tax=Seminavis robusta TaxID=568900 RepID=A0A9N8H2X4_9STRA|nr:expressed unknown protein [Seminavis robusta]|eukprot:Sro16_g011810.1 n/a (4779) ;mRNA; f:116079-130510